VSETTTIREAVGDGAEGTHPMLLAGVATEGTESLPVIFPYDGSEIARVWLADDPSSRRRCGRLRPPSARSQRSRRSAAPKC